MLNEIRILYRIENEKLVNVRNQVVSKQTECLSSFAKTME